MGGDDSRSIRDSPGVKTAGAGVPTGASKNSWKKKDIGKKLCRFD